MGKATGFAKVAELAEALAAEPGRLKKRAAIAEAVRSVHDVGGSEDAGWLCLYLAGQPFAEADPRKLSAGGALLTRAVKQVSGCSDAQLAAAYRKHGDLGAAAAEVCLNEGRGTREEGRESLTLLEVDEAFAAMAVARTTAARSSLVEGLLRWATALEAKYLLKLMLGDMRIGVKQSLIEEAIAVAASRPGSETPDPGHPVSVAAVRHAVMLEADLARVVQMAFAGMLAEARMRLFHPLGFMLASPVDTPEQAMERFGEAEKVVAGKDAGLSTALRSGRDEKSDVVPEGLIHAYLEDKFDGMRAQLHCGDPKQAGRVALYSRNREEITQSFPELVEAFQKASTAFPGPMILDGEILGWDHATGKAMPFSQLGQRIGRKRVDAAMRRAVPVVFMAFDVLFQDEELLLSLPLRERRARLEPVVRTLADEAQSPLEAVEQAAQGGLFDLPAPAAEPVPRLMLSVAQYVESAEQIDQAYRDARLRANEGVMLKLADSVYQPGRRGLAWAKLKRELATLDVVITGAATAAARACSATTPSPCAALTGSF